MNVPKSNILHFSPIVLLFFKMQINKTIRKYRAGYFILSPTCFTSNPPIIRKKIHKGKITQIHSHIGKRYTCISLYV